MTPEDVRLGRALRALRHRKAMRQSDVARDAGVSQSVESRAERGLIGGMTVAVACRLFAAVGARLQLNASWDGAAIDRLLDERHAAIVEAVAKYLRARGWTVVAEISFAHFGERGSFDLLAWHPSTRSLLIVEAKTELGSIEATLRVLDLKSRHAARVARERFGWIAATTSRLIVFPEDRTVRRQVARHWTTMATVLPSDSQAVRRWIRNPRGQLGGIWFSSGATIGSARRQNRRVRATS